MGLFDRNPEGGALVAPMAQASGGGGGEVNTASNLGTGSGVFASKVGVDLQFKSLVAGSGITITPSATELLIAATSSGANTALSNLAATALNASIIPATDNAVDLGSSTKHFNEVYTYAVQSNGAFPLYMQAEGAEVGFYNQIGVFSLYSDPGAPPQLRFWDDNGSNWVAFKAPTTAAGDTAWTLPSADGTAGQVLSTDGSGLLSWVSSGGFDPDTSPVQFLNGFIEMRDDAADWWSGSNTKLQNGNAMTDTTLVIGTHDMLTGGDVKKNLTLLTGTQDGGPNGGTGQFDILTGHVWSGTGNSGNFFIETGGIGTGVTGQSGTFDIQTGDNVGTGGTGSWNFRTGNAVVGNTGSISLATGTTASGTRGAITLSARMLNLTFAPLGSNWLPDTNGTWNLGSGSFAFSQLYVTQIFSNTGNTLSVTGDAGINYDAVADKHDFASTGRGIVIPRLASDPGGPENGEIWYNTTSNTFKGYENGTVKTFTTI